MTSDRRRQIEELYHAALKVEPAERASILAQADPALRLEVESLLAQRSSESSLDRPASEAMPGLLEATVTQAPDAQFGPYKIEERIGAGGMSEVFRAVDTRLGRKVAVKISRRRFDGRFEREARVISSFNHPHICTLYDVGPDYLVMELVEGQTLADRLKKGKLSLAETVRYGSQIADALMEAHAKGIVHRDLKPGNIMLARSGVKVLDFGLAKQQNTPGETLTASHVIIGTPAYMTPEQLEGKATDSRTDIYALGLILYEMATGKRAVPGQTRRMGDLPVQLAHVIERCLAQDPDDRWQSARDVKAEVQWAAQDASQTAGSPKNRMSWRWAAAAVIAAAAVGAAVALISGGAQKPSASAQPFSFRIPVPEGLRMIGRSTFSISPDGKALAFLAARSDGVEHVWVQRIGELEAKLLPDTESPHQSPAPFWSPDGKTIVFYADRKLKKINLNGGPPQTICDVSTGASGGSWNHDDVIIFGDLSRGVMRVPAAGGTPTPLTAIDRGERVQAFPVFLPDARHFLYVRGGGPEDINGIYIGSIDAEPGKQDPKRRLATPFAAQIVPIGDSKVKLLYLRTGTLMAQDFDTAKLQLTGEPETVTERVGNSLSFGFFAASPGSLAYRTAVAENIQLQWFDRQGKPGPAVGEPITGESSIALSPDGQRALVHRLELKTADIWALDLHRQVFLRLTTNPALDLWPIWSPDGKRFAYASIRAGPADIFQGVDGEVREDPLLQSSVDKYPMSWSADGQFLLYGTRGANTKGDLWALPFDQGKAGTPFPVVHTPANEWDGMYSPDGKWIAYTSDETGSTEVYVRSFRAAGESKAAAVSGSVPESKALVSTAGGTRPRWRRDGKELFWVAPSGELMAVEVRSENSFRAGTPQALFRMASPQVWDVAADGKRFLLGVPIEQGGQVPFTVVINWTAGLKH
jgi:serine/threonine protein kinase/Tol biopolymer transport system component